MKTILLSCVLVLGLGVDSHNELIRTTLTDYINWTTTGQFNSSSKIFSDMIDLTYQVSPDEFLTGSFEDYRAKIQSGAKTISRTMNIKSLQITDKKAMAILTDCSTEHFFSLVHHLTLMSNGDSWKIESISISMAE